MIREVSTRITVIVKSRFDIHLLARGYMFFSQTRSIPTDAQRGKLSEGGRPPVDEITTTFFRCRWISWFRLKRDLQ